MSKYWDTFGISEIWTNQFSNKTIYIVVENSKFYFWGNYLLDLLREQSHMTSDF